MPTPAGKRRHVCCGPMRECIRSFYSADGRHQYQRVGWQDGRIVWRMWSSWSNAKGVIDWLIVKTATMPKSATRADVVRKLKEAK